MNIRYFFVADVQKRNEIKLQFCPTDEMIADFFTKPLSGAKFRRFRNIIMNVSHDEYGPVEYDELTAAHYAKMNKRVDANDNVNASANRTVETNADEDSQECVGIIEQRGHKKPTYSEIVKRAPSLVLKKRRAHQQD